MGFTGNCKVIRKDFILSEQKSPFHVLTQNYPCKYKNLSGLCQNYCLHMHQSQTDRSKHESDTSPELLCLQLVPGPIVGVNKMQWTYQCDHITAGCQFHHPYELLHILCDTTKQSCNVNMVYCQQRLIVWVTLVNWNDQSGLRADPWWPIRWDFVTWLVGITLEVLCSIVAWKCTCWHFLHSSTSLEGVSLNQTSLGWEVRKIRNPKWQLGGHSGPQNSIILLL